MAEKRIQKRKQVEQRCWIALETIQSLAECFLRDVSHTGAKIILQTESKLPKTFDLYLTPNGNVGRNCELIWQDGLEIGVKFVGRAVPRRTLVDSVQAPMMVDV